MRRAALSCFLCLVAACGSPPPPAAPSASTSSGDDALERYPIVLSRPPQVGDSHRERTVLTESRSQVFSLEGRVLEQSAAERTVELAATVLVRAVDEHGEPTRLEYRVERLIVREADGEREMVPAGSVLHVRRVPREQGEGSIELAGGALSAQDADILDTIISTRISPVGDDAVFGSAEPRAVGERWPIDAGIAARDLNKMPELAIREEHVRGHSTIEALEEVDGVPCLRIRAELQATGFSMQGLENATTEHSEMRAVMTGALPLDLDVGRLRSSEELEVRIRMRVPTPDGRAGALELHYATSQRSEYVR